MAEFDEQSREERLQHEAEELMRQKRYQDAAHRYRDLRHTQPTDLWASLGYCSALELAGHIPEAEQILEEVTLRHRRSGPLHRFRHMFFERREDLPRASSSQAALDSEVLDDGPEDQLADLYFNQGRYHEAQSELSRLLRADRVIEGDLRASILARIGACLRQTGEHEAARTRLLEALALEGDHHWTLSELAETERALGDVVNARKHYHAALESNPDDHWCRGHLAQLEAEQGERERSIALYRQILTAEPTAAWALVELAQILADREPAESRMLCEQALAADATYPWAHAHLGQLARREGRLEEARKHYESALETAPDAPWVLHELADLCRHLGHLDDARRLLDRALVADPYDATTYGYFADLLRAEGKTPQAIAHLEKAVEFDADYTWAWRELAELRALAGKHAEAEAAYRRACEVEPDEAVNDGLKAFILRCAGRRDASLPWLERAVEKQKDYLWAWRELVDLHLARGRASAGETAARAGLEQLKDNVPLLGLLAEALRRQGRHQEAHEPLDRALANGGQDVPQLHALKAEVLAEQGDPDEALPFARRAAELDESPEYRALLAQVLVAIGEHDEAGTLVRELLQSASPIQPAFELAAGLAERAEDPDEAIRWCERGLEAHPGDPRLRVRRARLAVQAGRSAAIDDLLPLLDQPVGTPLRDISQIFAQAGRPVQARRAAYQLIAAMEAEGGDERRSKAWLHLAEIELSLGAIKEADEAVVLSLALDEDCVPARILSAVLCERRGDIAGAIAHLDHIDRRLHEGDNGEDGDDSALLLRQLAGLHERAGELAKAHACWDRIIARTGDDDAWLCDRASFRLRSGDPSAVDGARIQLSATDHALPEAQRLLRELAIVRANAEGPKAGLDELAQHENRLATHNLVLLAQLALAHGEAPRALAAAERVLRSEDADEHRQARLLRIRARLAQHQPGPAEAEARDLVAASPTDEEASSLLAEAVANDARAPEALAILTAEALPSPAQGERGLFIALLTLEVRDETTFLAALGRLDPPRAGHPVARVLALAWPGAWGAPSDHEVGIQEVLALPPLPTAIGRIATRLAACRRPDLAAALALAVATAIAGDRPLAARSLQRAAVPWLRQAGRRREALRWGWQSGGIVGCLRALI